MIPLYSESHPDLDQENLYALDTETTLFHETTYGWKTKTRIRPFGGHTLVLGSVAGAGLVRVFHKHELLMVVGDLLRSSAHIVFHNAPFDIPVLVRADPSLEPLFIAAVIAGRIHDTKILEVLIQIANGSTTAGQKRLVSSPSLKSLALSRAGLELDKVGGARLTFERYLDPSVWIPAASLKYAAQDAEATYRVYRSQVSEACLLSSPRNCRYPIFPDASRRFGLLSERIQIQGALALEWLERYPLRVDTTLACKTRDRLESECFHLERALIGFKWASRGPRSGKFSLKHKLLRGVLQRYSLDHDLVPEYTDTGLLSLEADFWSRAVPKIGKELHEHPEEASTDAEKIQIWLRYARARKLLTTYIYVYASSPVHYPRYENIGARTGRTSSSKPNAQNIPKRHDGIRALFHASEGHVLLEADFRFAELVGLAQVYDGLFGGSKLGRTINTGGEPHVERARELIPEFDSLPEDRQKHFRQAAKAVNFGLPGGLGAATFRKYAQKSFGVELSLDEAREIRTKALDSDPELARYLEEKLSIEAKFRLAARNLGISFERLVTIFDCWHPTRHGEWDSSKLRARMLSWVCDKEDYSIPLPVGFSKEFDLFKQTTCTLTGRIREKASFTEAHNTPFQGLVADGGKIALWNLYCEWARFGKDDCFRPVAYIHDSILIEHRKEKADLARDCLGISMISGLREVCPAIQVGVDFIECGERWGKNTNPWGEPNESF